METICTGRLSLEIDAAQTRASLAFSAGEGGEAWTRQKILELLKKAAVLDFVNHAVLEKALDALSRGGARTLSVVVAEGEAPRPDPEAIRWEENPVPAGIAAKAAEAVRLAPAPRVFDWRYLKRRVDEGGKGAGKGKAATIGRD